MASHSPNSTYIDSIALLLKPFRTVSTDQYLPPGEPSAISWLHLLLSRVNLQDADCRSTLITTAVCLAVYSGSSIAAFARFNYCLNGNRVIRNSYAKFKKTAWKLAGDDIIVLPERYVEEIRQLPLHVCNAMEANVETLQGHFTNLGVLNTTRLFVDVLKAKLNPQLGIVVPTLRRELDECMAIELPKNIGTEQWVKLEAFQTFHKINGRLSGRLFGGPELRRHKAFLAATEGFLMNIFITAMSLRLVPSGFKTFFSWILPCSWCISRHYRNAIADLVPYIRERKRTFAQRQHEVAAMGKSEFPDILHYLIEAAEGADAQPKALAAMILSLSLASNQTTTMALVESIYDLCAHPEYQPELREEALSALAEDNGWKKTTVTHMRKLDSFVKESQRVHPPAYMGFKRKFRNTTTLSDGLVLPAGAHVEFPITCIQDDSVPDPDQFDPLRWYRLRQDPEQANQHQFAASSDNSLHFGHGRYACPGRFMSASLIKMTLATMLLEYEFKLDVEKRPESWHCFEFNLPNPLVNIMLRKRSDAAVLG